MKLSKAIVVISLLIAISTLAADESSKLFTELVTKGTSGERRDALVADLSARSFSEVGTQAVQAICSSRGFGIYNAMTAKPWLEDQCPDQEKIRYAASAIWRAVIERAQAGSLSEQLAILCLEARPENERLFYLNALFSRHYNDRAKSSLERIVREETEPPAIAVKAAEILLQKEDANTFFPVLVAACKRIKNPLPRSEQFRFATQQLSVKLNNENRKLFLNYGFSLLSQIDDKKSGTGYFLAGHLGDFIGIKPVRDGQCAFAPNQLLPKYQGKHGLTDSFFQETVNNARKWWRKNERRYSKED
jgi:hypothetical protein